MMEICIVCSDEKHPVVSHLREWIKKTNNKGHSAKLVFNTESLGTGDILFLVSCTEIIGKSERDKYGATLVLHASDLPEGRGWSPHIWEILAGNQEITVSLLEAQEPVDSGPIWLKTKFTLEGHELLPEINKKLFEAELSLMDNAVDNYGKFVPEEQSQDIPPSFWPRRTPEDSRLDPEKTIAEQFNLLRVADSERYPAFFEYQGQKYILKVEKDEPR